MFAKKLCFVASLVLGFSYGCDKPKDKNADDNHPKNFPNGQRDPLDRDPSLIEKEDCESHDAYIWKDRKCQLKTEYECKQKGWVFENNACLSPSEKECKQNPEWVWQEGNCLNKKEQECKKQETMEWNGTACLSKEELACATDPTKVWHEGKCLGAAEIECKKQNNIWENGICNDRKVYECEKENKVWFENACISKEKARCEETKKNIQLADGQCIPSDQNKCEKGGGVYKEKKGETGALPSKPKCASKEEVEREKKDAEDSKKQEGLCLARTDEYNGHKLYIWDHASKNCRVDSSMKECSLEYTTHNLLSISADQSRKVFEIDGEKVVKQIQWSLEEYKRFEAHVALNTRAHKAGLAPEMIKNGLCKTDDNLFLYTVLPKLKVVSPKEATLETVFKHLE